MKCTRFVALMVILLHYRVSCAQPTPASFAYVLQADSFAKTKAGAVKRLASSGRDWIVLDLMFDDGTPWKRTELDAIRGNKPGRKIIAYLSVGEAEDYRSYWRSEWRSAGKLTPAAPSWLGQENPAWKGNYRVHYWDANWQNLVLAVVDDAMARGFDGLYLDIVDGFEFFERKGKTYIDDRINPATGQSYRRDMVDWVKTIAGRARRIYPAALIVPQNGVQLLAHQDYLATITAIGIEDLFTDGNKRQSKSHTTETLRHLQPIMAARKPVLLIEYPTNAARKAFSIRLARKAGFVWIVTDRQLKTLGTSGR